VFRANDSVYKELSVGETAIIEDAVVLAFGREELSDAEVTLRKVRKHVEMFPSSDYDSVNVWFEKLKKLVGK